MASLNRVTLIGNVGSDVEMRYLPSGDGVANFRLATTDKWKEKQSGEQKEATEWHRLVCFRRLAEIANEYVKKGSQLYIEGSIKTRKWTDKDGAERYSTEIEVTELKMLGRRREGDGQGNSRPAQSRSSAGGGVGNGDTPTPSASKRPSFDEMEEDIPFAAMSMAYDTTFTKATSRVRRTV